MQQSFPAQGLGWLISSIPSYNLSHPLEVVTSSPISQMRKWRLREADCSGDRAKIPTDGFYWSAVRGGWLFGGRLPLRSWTPNLASFSHVLETLAVLGHWVSLWADPGKANSSLPRKGPHRDVRGPKGRVSGVLGGLGPILCLRGAHSALWELPSKFRSTGVPRREEPQGPL